MKLTTLGLDKKAKGSVVLPQQFSEELRPEIIKRAVEAIQKNRRQVYAAKLGAGQRQSGKLSRRRRDYKTSYGHGISRVPRKSLTKRGTRFYWVGAVAPGMVKGRRAHPPKATRVIDQKVNKKENRKAIRSAMSATVVKDLVARRGHLVPQDYPFAVDGAIESVEKTNEIFDVLTTLGFAQELERGAEKKVRAGRGKMRGRKYKRKTSVLIVVSDNCKLLQSGSNIPGVDVVKVTDLNAELLAPGAMPGRATLWSEKALDRLSKEHLFI